MVLTVLSGEHTFILHKSFRSLRYPGCMHHQLPSEASFIKSYIELKAARNTLKLTKGRKCFSHFFALIDVFVEERKIKGIR